MFDETFMSRMSRMSRAIPDLPRPITAGELRQQTESPIEWRRRLAAQPCDTEAVEVIAHGARGR